MTIDRLKTHLGSVLLASLLLSLLQPTPLPAQAGTDEEEQNPSAKAVWKVERTRGEEVLEFEVTIFQIPAPGGNRWVWRATASNGTYPGGFPIGSMLIRGSGKPRPELFDPLSPAVMEMLLSVHGAGSEGAGLGWADGTPVGLRRQISVERTEAVDDDGQLILTGLLAGGQIQIRGGARALRLSAFKETLYLSGGGSLKRAEWAATLLRGDEENATSEERTLRVERLEAGLIEEEESQQVEEAYEFLAPVVRVLRKGMSLAAVEMAEKMFEKGQKDHKKGPLAEVVDEVAYLLKSSKKIASQPLDPDVRAKKMMGKPAPDFSLEGLDGKMVNLSDFKGKTMMVAFWGYS
ncbi:MAG TPA: redoxin domain-containing protein [Planctomycetes bacterium]|nr:redoxin domain-containing protein [Planctomycetota bacterium]